MWSYLGDIHKKKNTWRGFLGPFNMILEPQLNNIIPMW